MIRLLPDFFNMAICTKCLLFCIDFILYIGDGISLILVLVFDGVKKHMLIKENDTISHHKMIEGIVVGNLFQREIGIKDVAYLQ